MNLSQIILICSSIALSTSGRSLDCFKGTSSKDVQLVRNVPGRMASLMTVYQSEFSQFKDKYRKIYQTVTEEETRFMNFVRTIIEVNNHNDLFTKGQKSFKMAINHMSDWSQEERMGLSGVVASNSTGSLYLSPRIKMDLPESIDWREKGAVTEVKSQKSCGSCYAFSATGALEGQIWRKTGKLISLSEQQIVDCDLNDAGCNGGLPARVFEYIKTEGGIETERDYPYVSRSQDEPRLKCKFKKDKVVASDTGYIQLPVGDEEKLREAVATIGPISIGIYAPPSLHHYDSGIFHDDTCASRKLNHGVLLVGYGTEKSTGTPYWIIKNSWGPDFGENGYFRMKRNINSCNMANMSTYPLV